MTTETATPAPAGTEKAATPVSRRKLRAEGRRKRALKLKDKEFAKTFFAAKSKRAIEKKAAFRKMRNKKK